MDIQTAVDALNGSQYRREGSKELFAQMKAAGLVAVFGASDDLMEFEGAIHEEVDCCNGGTAHIDIAGLVTNPCEDDECPYHAEKLEDAATIEAKWNDAGDPCWTYETKIPHQTFVVFEDDVEYCRGIVFDLDKLEP